MIVFLLSHSWKERPAEAGTEEQDRESGELGSPPASPSGSRAKSQSWEMLGLQLNHAAKAAHLVLAFPLALYRVTCPAPAVLGAGLDCCSLVPSHPTGSGVWTGGRTGGSAPLHGLGWQGLHLLLFPRPQQLLPVGLQLLLWAWPFC